MNVSRRALLGVRQPRRRVVGATVGLLAGCTFAFLVRLDTAIPLSGWELGFAVFAVGLVVAAYAGWTHGGALPGVSNVFLLLLWMAFFPPAVAYLRGKEHAGGRYSTVRLSEALYTPGTELGVAIGTVPYLLVGALLFGGGAFLSAPARDGSPGGEDPPVEQSDVAS